MHVTVAHNFTDPKRPDQVDTLNQVRAVSSALEDLGHQVSSISVDLDLAGSEGQLARLVPDAVFNLVEELDGDMRLTHLAPALFEHIGLNFTGSGSGALMLSGDKLLCKKLLTGAKIATPGWIEPGQRSFSPGLYILKSVHEHASLGMDDDSVVHVTAPGDLDPALYRLKARYGGSWFAERYVRGREFNISILETAQGPAALPPAEILFHGFAPGRPKIVGYAAKWNETSFEFDHTPRTFDFARSDGDLLHRLKQTALQCWDLFGLSGYARVDFRVNRQNTPLVIDVNANPCLSPDAGLAAAAFQAGIAYRDLIEQILSACMKSGILPARCLEAS